MTVIWQTHSWRGLKYERQLFDNAIICGLFTAYISREPLLDKLIEMLKRAKEMDDNDDYAGC